MVGFGGLPTPQIIRGACYVHIAAEPGAAAGLYERLSEIGGVSGAAVLGGRWDLIACIPEPWEVASGIVLDKIHALPGRPDHQHARLGGLRGARRGPRPVQLLVVDLSDDLAWS